jgi:hypothetical protein
VTDGRNRKLAAGIIFYDDSKGIERLLASIESGVDLMICVDGRFPEFPASKAHHGDLSSDGSREVVKSFDKALLLDFAASEYEKRSKYLSVCEEQNVDYLLILDTDEYAEPGADWGLFRRNMVKMAEEKHNGMYNVYAVLVEVNSDEYVKTIKDKPYVIWTRDNVKAIDFGYYPRLWYRPEQMEYHKGTHYLFHNKDPQNKLHFQETNPAMEIVEGVRFLHRNSYRSESALSARQQYQLGFLVPYEAEKVSKWYAYNSWNGINATADSKPL